MLIDPDKYSFENRKNVRGRSQSLLVDKLRCEEFLAHEVSFKFAWANAPAAVRKEAESLIGWYIYLARQRGDTFVEPEACRKLFPGSYTFNAKTGTAIMDYGPGSSPRFCIMTIYGKAGGKVVSSLSPVCF